MQINKIGASPVQFRGASFDKAGEQIRACCLSKKSSQMVTDTIERLSKTSDKFKRNINVKLSTPPRTVNAYSIEAFDKKDKSLLGIKMLMRDNNGAGAKETEFNKTALDMFEDEVRKFMEYRYSRGYDVHGEPILNTIA